jgi:hypothetical protein
MTDKDAEAFLDDLLTEVRPPKGVAIVVLERAQANNEDPNWIASMKAVPADCMERYIAAIARLRLDHPRVDWDGITERAGNWRRVAKWLSEV